MSGQVEALLERIGELPQWQIALAASWILLQACVLPSVPEEIVITTLGMLGAHGRISPPLAFAAVLLGLLPANSAAVFLGSLGRSRIGRRGWLGRLLGSPEVTSALDAVRYHGPGLVLVTRFIPFVRGPVYLATGLSGLPVRRFFALDALAACVQVPLLLWVGSHLGRDGTAQEAWMRIGWLSVGFVALALLTVLARRIHTG